MDLSLMLVPKSIQSLRRMAIDRGKSSLETGRPTQASKAWVGSGRVPRASPCLWRNVGGHPEEVVTKFELRLAIDPVSCRERLPPPPNCCQDHAGLQRSASCCQRC